MITTLGEVMRKKREVVTSAWSNRADKANRGVKKEGYLFKQANDARATLLEASKYRLLSTDTVGNHVAEAKRGALRPNTDTAVYFSGSVALPTGSAETVNVAIRVDDGADRFYIIDGNGVTVNSDTMLPLDPTVDTDELDCVRYVLGETTGSLKRGIASQIKRKNAQREAVIRRWRIAGITVVSVGLVGGGATLGIYKWFVEPAHEATAYAQVYDTEQHNLPGEGAPVAAYPLEVIDTGTFNAVPKLRRGDESLDSPRRTNLSRQDGCSTIGVDLPNGARLRAVMSEGNSAYASNGFSVTKNGDSIEICLVNYDTNSSSSSIPIAVQAIASKE